jgi:phosphonate degradation associated HDIG domain protein
MRQPHSDGAPQGIDSNDWATVVRGLFARSGHRQYAGEAVTQLEHALQTAWLAERAGASPALVAAALLHDLGHLWADCGETPTLAGLDDRHEQVAESLLSGWLGPAVAQPVALHVAAKRYLCARGGPAWTAAEYRAALSPDSERSLVLQGGPMTDAEADAFERSPWFDDALRLRLWDDAAKVAGLRTPTLDHFLAHAPAPASGVCQYVQPSDSENERPTR